MSLESALAFRAVRKAANYGYHTLLSNNYDGKIFPWVRFPGGPHKMYSVSSEHGRSYVVGFTDDGRFIVSKGNGLSYSQYSFLNSGELGVDSWGLLLKKDAVRDFQNGLVAASYGILTNRMHCVIELDYEIIINMPGYPTIHPALLQYDVECPYRLSDVAFIPREIVLAEVNKWPYKFGFGYEQKYLVAAEVLLRNLSIMHSHNFLHNALTIQNYTWALELLDFELSRSEQLPYDKESYEKTFPSLFSREYIHTYQIITFIADVLGEPVDFKRLDDMFLSFGFDLGKLSEPIK